MKRIVCFFFMVLSYSTTYCQTLESISSSDELFEKGLSHHLNGFYEEAVYYFNEFLKLEPNSADGFGLRGMSKCYLNDYQGAIIDCSRAID